MVINKIVVYILVYCAAIAELYALDVCKDTKVVPVCKENEKYCFNAPTTWRIFMEKVCMATCKYCTTDNVAVGKNTKQSSYFDQIVYNSSNAVDGESRDKYGSCSVTDNSDFKSWWCVDLEKQYTIKEINVYGGINAKVNLTNFTVILSNTGSCDEATLRSSPACYKDPGSTRNPYSIDRCNEGNVDFNGRFVFITKDKEYTSLGLCEVQVYSARCSDGFYESSIGTCLRCNCDARPCDPGTGRCLKKCPINCKNDKCDVTGRCTSGCNVGFHGSDCTGECSPNCKDDVCYGVGVCSDCRDGFYGNVCSKNCSNCKPGGCKRNSGVCINGCNDGFYGAGRRCKKVCPNCNPGGCKMNDGVCINGCKYGFYGKKCELKCSTCKPGGCDKQGVCTNGCLDGFYGSDGLCLRKCPNCLPGGCEDDGICINGCKAGWYKNKCITRCSSDCQGGCNRLTGRCTACSLGRYGDTCKTRCGISCRGGCNRLNGECTTCSPGRYGDICQNQCSYGCQGGCNRSTGTCITCSPGRYGDYCQHMCSDGCISSVCSYDGLCLCKASYYGNKCESSCPDTCFEGCRPSDGYCNACITGYYGGTCNQTCSSTCGGRCNRDGKCLRCSKGFYGEYCDKNCSNNCIDSHCEGPINDLVCSKGCVEGKTWRYCSKNCPQHCIHCDQFNRNQCSVCKDGWRGSVCSQSCSSLSENCIKCHQDLPRCYSCKSGRFGKRCHEACPTGCLDDTCNVNGTCISCNSGSFGPMCNETCPIGCLDDICNMDGRCKACKHGYYGITCDKMCSTNCTSSTGLTVCNITDGSCSDDRGDGTSGQNCKEDCELGYYGPNCDEVCHCYQSQCDQDTGECDYGCEHGWMGSRCDQVKAPAEVATYCVNSPTKGKYALLRVDTKNIKYDKIYVINESQDTSSSTTCDQRMFNEDADGVLNLKILIEDDNTFPSCYHTKTDRGIFKWTLRTEEVSGFYSYYDRLYELSCDFTTAETLTRNNKQAISGIYQPSKVKITQTTEEVQLFIQNPATTSRVSQVQIGSRIQLAMLLNKRDGITASGISPYNCSCSTPDRKTVHQLTDSSGCPVRDSPVLALTGSNGSYVTSNIFDAFTVEGSLGLIFSCSFEFCFDSNDTKCTDRCSDQRTRSILGVTSRTKRSTNGNRKNGQASTYLLLIPKTQKDKQTDMNNISVEGTVFKHLTVITGSILVLVLCGGLVAVALFVRSSHIKTVMKPTSVKITE